MADPLPLQITFRNMESSAAVEDRIRERVQRLERFNNRIIEVRVVVENPHKSSGSGKNPLGIAVEVEVPGRKLVSRSAEEVREAKGDVLLVVNEVFATMERQLDDEMDVRRGRVKEVRASAPTVGTIVRLFPDQSYGFVQISGGPDLYFTRNAVAGDAYDKLKVGDLVSYTEAPDEGPMGPQAHEVRRIAEGERKSP